MKTELPTKIVVAYIKNWSW